MIINNHKAINMLLQVSSSFDFLIWDHLKEENENVFDIFCTYLQFPYHKKSNSHLKSLLYVGFSVACFKVGEKSEIFKKKKRKKGDLKIKRK